MKTLFSLKNMNILSIQRANIYLQTFVINIKPLFKKREYTDNYFYWILLSINPQYKWLITA